MKNNIKRFLSVLLALTMCIAMSATAFATDSAPGTISEPVAESVDEQVQPYGTLSGYGSYWYNSGEKTDGSFIVEVKGSPWTSAHFTLNMVEFNSYAHAFIWIYRPDGTLLYSSADDSGTTLCVANSKQFENRKFLLGQTGTYRVVFQLRSTNGPVSSGRFNCWIY